MLQKIEAKYSTNRELQAWPLITLSLSQKKLRKLFFTESLKTNSGFRFWPVS